MFIFNPYHMTLRATCNDTMKVFFDGYLQPETAAMGRWNETSYLNIPANTNVLAIKCKNSEYQNGIPASSSTGLKTDASWQCSSVYVDGWTLPGFDPPINQSIFILRNNPLGFSNQRRLGRATVKFVHHSNVTLC